MGKESIGWCEQCNVPVIVKQCSVCNTKTKKIQLTPPAETKPALPWDVDKINSFFLKQYNVTLLDNDAVCVMSKVSGFDYGYELVQHGFKLGIFGFDGTAPFCKLHLPGAQRIFEQGGKKWVRIEPDVVKFLEKGDLLVPGVSEVEGSIEIGDEVFVVTDSVVATGTAKMSSEEMKHTKRGVAVRIRKFGTIDFKKGNNSTWSGAVKANKNRLDGIEQRALSFIKDAVKRSDARPLVAYSGGKDSLVTLALVHKVLDNYEILFVNTGLEFPETIENINKTKKHFNIEKTFVECEAGNAFWDNLDTFGPPAMDFRWCCKVCKLGPVAEQIKEKWGKSITFGGERKYESFSRAKRPTIDQNPWIPNQTSAYPILHWTGLDVWLYIFREELPVNELYYSGYERVGCWLCPSSSQWEFLRLQALHPHMYNRWFDYLKKYEKETGQKPGWHKDKWTLMKYRDIKKELPVEFSFVGGTSPCKTSDEFIIEGLFSGFVNTPLFAILGKQVLKKPFSLRTANNLTFQHFPSGKFTIRKKGLTEEEAKRFLKRLKQIIIRSKHCTLCGICVSSCPENALYFDNKSLCLNKEKCTGCLSCLRQKCPLDFLDS